MNMKREKPPLEVILLLAACVTATFALVTSELSQRLNDLRGVEERSCSKGQFRTIYEPTETRPESILTRSRDSFDPKLVRRREGPFKELGRERQVSPENQVYRSDENCESRTVTLKRAERSERRREFRLLNMRDTSSIRNGKRLFRRSSEVDMSRENKMLTNSVQNIEQTKRTVNTLNRIRSDSRLNPELISETHTKVSNRRANVRTTESESTDKRIARSIESVKEGNRMSAPKISTNDRRVESTDVREKIIIRLGNVVRNMDTRETLTKQSSEEYSIARYPETKFAKPSRVVRNSDTGEKQMVRPFQEYNRARYAEIRRLYARLPHSLRYLEVEEVESEMRDSFSKGKQPDDQNARMSLSSRTKSANPSIISEGRIYHSSTPRISKKSQSSRTDLRKERASSEEATIRRGTERERYESENQRSISGERKGVKNTKRSAQSLDRSFKDTRRQSPIRHEDITSNVRIRENINRRPSGERDNTLRTERNVTTTIPHRMEIKARKSGTGNTEQTGRNEARDSSSVNRYAVSSRDQRNVLENSRHASSDVDTSVQHSNRQVRDARSREGKFRKSKVNKNEDKGKDSFSREKRMMSRDEAREAHGIRNSFNRPAGTESRFTDSAKDLHRHSLNFISGIAERKVSEEKPHHDTRQRESRYTGVRRITRQLERASRPELGDFGNMRVTNDEVQHSSSSGNLETLTNLANQDRIRIKSESRRISNDVLARSSMGNRRDMTNNVGEVNFRDTSNSRKTNNVNLGTSRGSREVKSNVAHEDRTRESQRGSSEERQRIIRNSGFSQLKEITRISPERKTQDRNSRFLRERQNSLRDSSKISTRDQESRPTLEGKTQDIDSRLSRDRQNLPRDLSRISIRDEESRASPERRTQVINSRLSRERLNLPRDSTRISIRDEESKLSPKRKTLYRNSRLSREKQNLARDSSRISIQDEESRSFPERKTQDINPRLSRERQHLPRDSSRISIRNEASRLSLERKAQDINSRPTRERQNLRRDSSRINIRAEEPGLVEKLRRTSSEREYNPTQERETIPESRDDLKSRRENGEQRSRLKFQREDRYLDRRERLNLHDSPKGQIVREGEHLESLNALLNFRTPLVNHLEHPRIGYRNRGENDSPSNRVVSEPHKVIRTYEDKVRQISIMRSNSHRNHREPNKEQLADRSNLRLNNNVRVDLGSNQENREVLASIRAILPVNTATVRQTRERTGEFKQETDHTRFDLPIHLNYFQKPTFEDVQSIRVSNNNQHFQRAKRNLQRGELKRSPRSIVNLEGRQIYEHRTQEIIQNREGSRDQFRQRRNLSNSQSPRLLKDSSTSITEKDSITINVSNESKKKGDYDSVIKMLHLIKDLIIMSCLVWPLTDYFDKKKNLDEKVFTIHDSVNDLERGKSFPAIMSPEKKCNRLVNRFLAKEHLTSY